MTLEKAKHVAAAKEWSGDMTVNWHTAIKAASVLARELEKAEIKIDSLRRLVEGPNLTVKLDGLKTFDKSGWTYNE